jgi:hypothetical protein
MFIIEYIKKKKQDPRIARMIDKMYFFVGVINLLVTEYIVIAYPEYFWYWFLLIIPFLILKRYTDYKSNNWLYFLLDFCYFANILCFAQIFMIVCGNDLSTYGKLFFQINFMFTNGPLAWAIVTWRNSFVFHSVDKITSVYIHLFPAFLLFCTRWYGNYEMDFSMDIIPVLGCCITLYCLWQLCYILKTEYFDKDKLDNDCTIQTSLRWMSSDTKNSMHKILLRILRKLRIMGPMEEFDAKTKKTKFIFVLSQFLFTLLTFIPIPFMFQSFVFNCLFLVFLLSIAIYNGGNYYIEVFSSRYEHSKDKPISQKN